MTRKTSIRSTENFYAQFMKPLFELAWNSERLTPW